MIKLNHLLAASLSICLLSGVALAKETRQIRNFIGQTYRVNWTTDNVEIYQANMGETPIYSFQEDAKKRFNKYVEELKADMEDYEIKLYESEELIKPLSLVGSVFSYETDQYSNLVPSAHPSSYRNYQVMDLSNPERKVNLTEFFNEQAIYTQLMRQPEIIQSLKALEVKQKPKNLQELKAALDDQMPTCEMGFYEDLLEHFAFHKITNNTATVQVAIPYGAEACRGKLTTLNLILPVEKPEVKEQLLQAQKLKNGFLMQTTKHNEKITGFAASYPENKTND